MSGLWSRVLGVSAGGLSIGAWCVLAMLASFATANEKEGDRDLGAYSFKMKSLSGEEVDLKKYANKVVLAVNVASRCGYTPQYSGLQALHEKYKDKGFAVIGIPCNQFGRQEPGTAKEIAEFCESSFGVTFDLLEKSDVNGEAACELYKYLTAQDVEPAGQGDVKWNFEKFLIGKDGQVVARFRSGTTPNDEQLVKLIEQQLSD